MKVSVGIASRVVVRVVVDALELMPQSLCPCALGDLAQEFVLPGLSLCLSLRLSLHNRWPRPDGRRISRALRERRRGRLVFSDCGHIHHERSDIPAFPTVTTVQVVHCHLLNLPYVKKQCVRSARC
jgi:hypothetical protein